MPEIKAGFALCGSFCTFDKVLPQMERLISFGYDLTPIMSGAAYETDTRFGKAGDFIARIEALTGKPVIHTIEDAEPIGPKSLFDIIIVAPCTGNTLAKLSAGISDGPVTMACKSHLRNGRPVLLAMSTNDALGAACRNIGELLIRKNYYFVPFGQDDPDNKPNSMIAELSMLYPASEAALTGRQLQPVLV